MKLKQWFFSLVLVLLVYSGSFAAYSTLEPQVQQEFNQLLDEAFNAYISKDYTKSMNLFQRALQMVPGDRTAEKGLIESREKLEEQQKEKMKIFRQRMALVRDELKKENWMEAIDQCHWLFANSINPAEVQLLRAEVETNLRKKMGNYPVASADRLIYEGLVSYLNRHFVEALKSWKDAVTMLPGNVKLTIYIEKAEQIYRETAYYEIITLGGQRAKEAFSSGNYAEAVGLWKKMLELEPQNSEALEGIQKAQDLVNKKSKEGLISDYYDKGLSAFLEENYEGSLTNWEGILAIDPTNEVAKDYINKIRAKGIVTPPQKVEISTPSASIEKKGSPYYEEAVSLYHQEKFESAKELFLKALEENPIDIDSKKWLEKVKKTQSEKVDEHYNKGLIAYSRGQREEAIKEWEKALEMDPTHGPSKRTLLKVKTSKGGTK